MARNDRLRLATLVMLVAFGRNVVAAPLLRPAGAPLPGSPESAAAAARAAQTAQAAASQANESLRRAAEAMGRFRAQQDAARAAAAAAASNVPNGLAAGGLVIAPGASAAAGTWTGANLPVQSSNGQNTQVTITQSQPKAILTWETFNVGRETDVHFDQTAGGASAAEWIALNRVTDPNQKPSQILGSIRAEGQVYLINPNGILFGGTSQVNVNSLIASSLDFYGNTLAERNRRFLDGILFNPAEQDHAALVFGEKFESQFNPLNPAPDAMHNPTETFAKGDGVTVEAGAQITATGGRAMLLGHNVVNAGTIQATDGEIVLGAGRGIYLNKNYRRGFQGGGASLDPDIRGLTIGVNRGGRVENTGILSSDRGSINIQGKSILQAGLAQATTSATANGFINMSAGDGIPAWATATPFSDLWAYGDLTFGDGSTTQIVPDLDGKTTVGFDQFRPSKMELYGRYVTFGRDSSLYAPSANVTVIAKRGAITEYVIDPVTGKPVPNPAGWGFLQKLDDARIYVDQGARLDVSGLRGVDVAMERNTIKGEIRANELKDNPILRDSFLRGQKVYFDARKGVSVADLSGYYDLIERGVGELMTQGGSLQLAGVEVITRAGSIIDLSGGSLNYRAGYVTSTLLVDRWGHIVPIEDAQPNVEYVGFAGDHLVNHSRWGVTERFTSPFRSERGHWEAGYVEGRSAGKLTVGYAGWDGMSSTANGYRILDGRVVADVVVGEHQKAAPAGATAKDVTRVWREVPQAATLNFGFLDSSTQARPVYGGNITIGNAAPLSPSFKFDSKLDPSLAYNHTLPAQYFDGKTFSVVNLYSGIVGQDATNAGGKLTIGEGVTVDLGSYGSFNFTGSRADINGTIRAPGGSVRIDTTRVAVSPTSTATWLTLDPALKPQINLGQAAVIDVAGRWVNPFLDQGNLSQWSIDGGSVSLTSSNNLNLAAGSVIDVSGGGRLSADGRKLTAGRAGSIALDNSRTVRSFTAPPGPRDGDLSLGGTLLGYGLAAGGTLRISTGKSVLIGNPLNPAAGSLVVSPDFFQKGGFANFIVTGSSGVTIAEKTVIAPTVTSFVLDNLGRAIATGSSLAPHAQLTTFSDFRAQPMSLAFSAPPVDVNGNMLSGQDYSPTIVENPGAVTVSTGAEIRMTPRSAVHLASGTNVFVDGTISTPGGLIDLRIGYGSPIGPGLPPTVRLGQNARLLAPGYVKTTADGLFTRRSVEDAGTVSFGTIGLGPRNVPSFRGVGFVMTDAGSVIDVSGVQAVADFLPGSAPEARPGGHYTERVVDGAAGSISVTTTGGGVLAGELRATPGGQTGRGGSIQLTAPRLTVTQSLPAALAHVTADSAVDRAPNLTVFADRLNASAADDLALRSNTYGLSAVLFDGGVSLSSRRSIEIDGPFVTVKPGAAGNVNLSSSYVFFALPQFAAAPAAPLPTKLGGSLTINADLIDVRGGVDFGCGLAACTGAGLAGGFADVRLVSKGDIRLDANGVRLRAGGSLTLDAAQVYGAGVYSTTRADPSSPGFLIEAGKSVTIRGNGAPAPVPFSYGQRITVRAPDIIQAGVLRAPLGEIRMEATNSVTLAPGSLTSTSLEGLRLPYGSYSGWIDPSDPFSYSDLTTLPNKTIKLGAPNVTVSQGATLDVSGGGDLAAWQFVAGNGGSRNILRDPGMFAVLPDYGTGPLPLGAQSTRSDQPYYTSSPLRVGDSVYLEGVPGLPAGRYTLLPPDYAMLKGGVLVRPLQGGFADSPVSIQRPDGSTLAGGYRFVNGTSIRDPGYTRFLVMPQDVFGKYSSFVSYSFNNSIATLADLASITARAGLDAGTVVLGATNSLVLDGTGHFGAAGNGLLGNLDISSRKIAITGGGAAAPAGYLAVDAGTISGFGAGSILIGGVRSQGATGTNVAVNATDVIVSNGASSALTGPEILIGATNSITVSNGSSISAQGRASTDTNPLLLNGNGAFLRASTGDRVDLTRIAANGSAGVMSIGAGVNVTSAGALTFDASKTLLLDSTAVFDAAQLELSSVKVSVGNVPSAVTGTVLAGTTLANLASAKSLIIRGSQSIDLYGSFSLGGRDASGAPTLGKLTLDTALLNGVGAAGDTASITAGTITVRNTGTFSAGPQSPSGGNLALDTGKLILGPGAVGIGGFAAVNARAGVVKAKGIGSLDYAGPMTLATDLVTAAGASDYAVRIGGDLSVVRAGGAAQTTDDFGGRLSLAGANLGIDTTVEMPAGVFEARATAGNLTLGNSATLKLSGQAVEFRDVVKVAPAGTLRLGASGDVITAAGSTIDVSGNARGGDAGAIEVTAGGRASLAGRISGTAAAGSRGGAFSLDAGTLADLGQLNSILEAGSMSRSRAIHVATGDLSLAAGRTITAHDVLLRADSGAVSIAGTINAAGDSTSPSGGNVRLVGGSGVSLAASARVDAHAAPTRPGAFLADSGWVEIAATGGRVNVAQGAVVDVSGGKQGGGKILVRAPRAGNDVAIDRLDGQFVGARESAIAGMQSYQLSSVGATQRDQMLADANAWMANAPAIQSRLGTSFEVRPGISINSTGDLAVAADIDLSGQKYGGAPGYLELLATGDINFNANISDGFASTARTAALRTGRSWTYRFDAGRDITVGAGQMIRTGTGDIRVHAGRDLVLKDNLSALYTAGSKTPTDAGFVPVSGRVTGEFPTQGGDLELAAGRDILAPVTKESTSGWLFRYGDTEWTGDVRNATVVEQSSWSVVFPNFEQGVGALGGGNVKVNAGRDVTQLAVALPTTGHMTTPVGGVAQEGDVRIRGGGNLDLRAGRDVKGGVFVLGQGAADVNAGGKLTYGDTLVNQQRNVYGPKTLAALFGLADATLTVNARAGSEIEAAFDPMLQGQICQNSGCSYYNRAINGVTAGSAFFGMTERTSMKVTSASGDVRYDANPWASVDVSRGSAREAFMQSYPLNDPRQTTNNWFVRAPGNVQLAALHDDVVITAKGILGYPYTPTLLLSPSDNGNLELLAKNGIYGEGAWSKGFAATMLDVGLDYRRGARNPFSVTQDTRMNLRINAPTLATNFDRGFTAAHINDVVPVRVYSMTKTLTGVAVVVPKPLYVYSGKDIADYSSFTAQNNRPDDLTSIVAARDIRFIAATVTGIGDLVLEAGRDIKNTSAVSAGDFPNRGIASTRNLALPAKQGANIYMYAGTSQPSDYDGFVAAYLDKQNPAHVVRNYLPELASYMKKLGFTGLSDDELVARFKALPLQSRKAFADQVFFSELKETGLDATDPNSPRYKDYKRGYDAIQRLFPRDTTQMAEKDRANIILNGARVETQAGGDITILAPYGHVEIGGPAIADGSGGGLITRKGGSIRVMADKNIDLFTSRAFTLLGGDLTMWTSWGDITAGVGAKTTYFRPPLVYNITNDGIVSINVFGLQTGAGIGVLDAGGTGIRAKSRMDLIAPHGEVNAGDAGIRVVGDLNIAALRVVGLDNIQVAGNATGLPKVVPPDTVAITEAGKAIAAATEQLSAAAPKKVKAEELPSILTVEVIGYETPKADAAPASGTRYDPASPVQFRFNDAAPKPSGDGDQQRRKQ